MENANPMGLYRKAGKGAWYLPIRFDDGKRIMRSTEEEDFKKANAKAPRIMADALSSYSINKNAITASLGWSIEKAFNEFISDRKRGTDTAANSIRNYENAKEHVCRILKGGKAIRSVRTEDFIHLYDRLRLEKKKHSTSRYVVNTFRTVLNFAKKRGHWEGDTVALIPVSIRKRPPPKGEYLSKEDVAKLFAVASDSSDRRVNERQCDYWKGYIFTGARRRELFRIEAKHVDLARNVLQIPGTKSRKSVRLIPIHPELRPILEKRMEEHPSGSLFPANAAIEKLLHRICKRAGIKDIVVHSLRHTFAAHLLSNGIPIQVVSKMLGHSDINVTMDTYGHIIPSAEQTAIMALPSFASAPAS